MDNELQSGPSTSIHNSGTDDSEGVNFRNDRDKEHRLSRPGRGGYRPEADFALRRGQSNFSNAYSRGSRANPNIDAYGWDTPTSKLKPCAIGDGGNSGISPPDYGESMQEQYVSQYRGQPQYGRFPPPIPYKGHVYNYSGHP